MPARLLMICCVALLALLPAACAGGAGDEDVDTLLQETFSGDKEVDSGRLLLKARVDARGSDQVQGPVEIQISGPFSKQGDDELPEFDLDASVAAAGMTYEAGVAAVDGNGYVMFGGEQYVLADQLLEQFKSGFAEGHEDKGGRVDLAGLGIDPREWLRDARNEGEAEVMGQDTIKITGDVDVAELLDDLSRVEPGAGAGGSGKAAPSELTDAQRRQIERAVEAMRVEIYTGADDRILRRVVFDADVVAPDGEDRFDSADVRLDYSLSELNEDQTIEAPQDPRPFSELQRQLHGLGLGGSGSSPLEGHSGTQRREMERYARCVERAGSDDAAVRECADLL